MESSLDKIVRLHGQKGKPGYEILHSPNLRVRVAAQKIYNKGGQALVAQDMNAIVPESHKQNMRPGGPVDYKKHNMTVAGYPALMVSDDPTASLQALATDTGKRVKYIYSASHDYQQKALKYQRIQELHAHIPALDAALNKDAMHDDTAAAVLLIRTTGMRPGSKANTGAKVQAYGATTLFRKNVRINKDSVSFTFTGKNAKPLVIHSTDKQLMAVVKARMDKGPNEQLFDTNNDKALAYLKSKTQQQFLIKDLRTYKGTAMALAEIEKVQEKDFPKTALEYRKAIKKVALVVAAQLGNSVTEALNSYINADVFNPWVKEDQWLM